MIRVAIVGTGAIAPSHVRGFLEFPDMCKIVALCDIKPEKAEKLAQQFSLNVDVYDDHTKNAGSGRYRSRFHLHAPVYPCGADDSFLESWQACIGRKTDGFFIGRMRCHAQSGSRERKNIVRCVAKPLPHADDEAETGA